MDINIIKKNARERMKGFCILCNECNGIWCAGKVPGMGGCGNGSSFKENYDKLKSIKLCMRTLHSHKTPTLNTSFLGINLDFPVISAPITGTKFNMGGYINDEEYSNYVISGSLKAKTIAMIGDTGDASCFKYGIEALKKTGGKGIAIIKPRENNEIIKRIKIAEEAGALAVGIDIDGAGLLTMQLFGQPVGPKSLDDLKELVKSTSLPFIVKGILSVDEAKLCVEAGVKAIVVSNHGGRCLNGTFSSVEVLPEISKAVRNKITILADGCVREGVDVLKYLALGADGVLVGRPIIWGAIGGGEDGVFTILNVLKEQLYQAMILTGVESIKDKNIYKILNYK